jgi:hypothetical protein
VIEAPEGHFLWLPWSRRGFCATGGTKAEEEQSDSQLEQEQEVPCVPDIFVQKVPVSRRSSPAKAAEKPTPPPDVDEATTAPVSRRSPDTPTSRGEKAKADVFPTPIEDIDMELDWRRTKRGSSQRARHGRHIHIWCQRYGKKNRCELAADSSGAIGQIIRRGEKAHPRRLQPTRIHNQDKDQLCLRLDS